MPHPHQLEVVLLDRLPRPYPPLQVRPLVNPHQAETLYSLPHLASHYQVEHHPQPPPPNRYSLHLDPRLQVLAVTGSHTHQVDHTTQKLEEQPHLLSGPHLLHHQEGAHRDHRPKHILRLPLLHPKRNIGRDHLRAAAGLFFNIKSLECLTAPPSPGSVRIDVILE